MRLYFAKLVVASAEKDYFAVKKDALWAKDEISYHKTNWFKYYEYTGDHLSFLIGKSMLYLKAIHHIFFHQMFLKDVHFPRRTSMKTDLSPRVNSNSTLNLVNRDNIVVHPGQYTGVGNSGLFVVRNLEVAKFPVPHTYHQRAFCTWPFISSGKTLTISASQNQITIIECFPSLGNDRPFGDVLRESYVRLDGVQTVNCGNWHPTWKRFPSILLCRWMTFVLDGSPKLLKLCLNHKDRAW